MGGVWPSGMVFEIVVIVVTSLQVSVCGWSVAQWHGV